MDVTFLKPSGDDPKVRVCQAEFKNRRETKARINHLFTRGGDIP